MKRMKKLCALALSAVLLAQAGTTMAFAMSNTANQENCFASLVEAAAKTPAVTVTSTILGMTLHRLLLIWCRQAAVVFRWTEL